VEWTIVTSTLLAQLQASPKELNEFLADVCKKTNKGFGQWKNYTE
jgi:hypothetical protein